MPFIWILILFLERYFSTLVKKIMILEQTGKVSCNEYFLIFRRDDGAAYCFRFSRFFFFTGDIQPLMAGPKISIGL